MKYANKTEIAEEPDATLRFLIKKSPDSITLLPKLNHQDTGRLRIRDSLRTNRRITFNHAAQALPFKRLNSDTDLMTQSSIAIPPK